MEEITNIKIGTLGGNKPAYVIENAVVTVISEPRTGVSAKTGNQWELISFNVQMNCGEGVPFDYMRITALNDKAVESVKKLRPGDKVDLAVQFNIKTQPSKTSGTAYQTNDVMLLEVLNVKSVN